MLSFFSGKRCVAIVSGVVSIVVSAVLLLVWPLLFGALVAIGKSIVSLDVVGAGIGEQVLTVSGSTARKAFGRDTVPVDAAIVAIIDTVEVNREAARGSE